MSKLSRSQKNQALYDSIKSDSEATLSQDELLALKDRIKGEVKIEEPTEKVYAKRKETYLDDITDLDSTLSSDALIKSFISEVKKYNIKSGLRTVEDTNLNILSELEEGIPLSLDIKPLPETNDVEMEADLELTKQNISEEIRRFLEEEKTYEEVVEEIPLEATEVFQSEDTIKDIISDVLKSETDVSDIIEETTEVVTENIKTDLLEIKELETHTLETKPVGVFEREIIDQKEIDNALNKDRLKSFFLFLGTLFLMVLASIFAYWFLTKGVK